MGVMTFEEWCSYKKRVMGETPAWFDDPAERRRRFEAYRIAFEENCSAATPLDAAFAPAADMPLDVISAPVAAARRIASRPSYLSAIRAAALVLVVQIMLFAAPAFASGNIVVNGNTLAAQDRVSLEAVVGPLEPGRYWAEENGDFGHEGVNRPIANLRRLIQQRVRAAQARWQAQQQYALRQQLKLAARIVQNVMRQPQAAPNKCASTPNGSSC
jgi:hypothetical protein